MPRTIGAPITRAVTDDLLRSSSWTTLPRASADGGSLGPLTVRAASICGRWHAHEGSTREDAFAIGQVSDGTVIAAIADGVGSDAARFAALGAHVATQLCCQLVQTHLEERQPVDAQATCRRLAVDMVAMARRFTAEQVNEAALATTLITAWVSPQGSYRGFMVGDGGVFSLRAGEVDLIRSPGDGLSTATEALPAAYRQAVEFFGELTPGSALLLATDGLSIPLTSPDVSEELGQSWSQPPTLLGFLTDISFERRGEHDDRTAVGIWFSAGQGSTR